MNLKLRLVFTLLMSLVLSSLMSGWVTFINLGLAQGFFGHWLHAFLLAWPAAATIAFVFTPRVQRLSNRLVAGD